MVNRIFAGRHPNKDLAATEQGCERWGNGWAVDYWKSYSTRAGRSRGLMLFAGRGIARGSQAGGGRESEAGLGLLLLCSVC